MVFRRLIAWFFRLPARRAKAVRIHPARLAMEVLEDRAVPASHTLAIVSPELMGRVPAAELANATVVALDPSRDALAQIDAALEGYGIAYVPEDRMGTGVAPSLPVAANLILKGYRSGRFSHGPVLWPHRIRVFAQALVERYRQGLLAAGIDHYPTAESAWLDYRKCVLYLWMYAVIISGALDTSNERARAVMRVIVERSAAAVAELDCLALLPEFE